MTAEGRSPSPEETAHRLLVEMYERQRDEAVRLATWDEPRVQALAKALSEAEMHYDDRDWLVLAETALTHLGLIAPASSPSGKGR